MPFTKLGLKSELMRALDASDYIRPTLIQSEAIPVILEGNDLIGTAQTGTGKTAAFVLPLLQQLERTTGKIRALILTPTRELAHQVELAVRKYGRFLNLRSTAIYGGVSQRPQEEALRKGVDLVVATPGRLLDLLQQRLLDLSSVKYLVLDEADRMLDMGFLPDVREVVRSLPKQRQTLLFSATLPQEIQELARSIQKNPVLVEAGIKRAPAAGVDQHLYPVLPHLKTELLLHLLRREAMGPLLVFTRTKHGADRLHRALELERFRVARIHSGRSQSQRQEALDGFRQYHYQILVATDVAARGIDVRDISHVINYDIPNNADDYIHRIGRTGRAEKEGIAYSFVSPEEEIHVQSIERSIQKKFNRVKLDEFNFHRPIKPRNSEATHASRKPSSRPARKPGIPADTAQSPKVFDRFAFMAKDLSQNPVPATNSMTAGFGGTQRRRKAISRNPRKTERRSFHVEGLIGAPSPEEQRELKRLQVKLFGSSSPRRPFSSRHSGSSRNGY